MKSRLFSSSCSVAALALLAVALAAGPAHAETANLNSMSFNAADATNAIHVISTDKQKWNALKTGAAHFEASMRIDTKHPGYVDDVAIVVGECDDTVCAGAKAIWSDSIVARDYSSTESVYLPTHALPVSGTGITLGDQIIARCNANLQADGPTKTHSFTHEIPVALIVDTGIRWLGMDNVPDEVGGGAWPHWPNQIDNTRNDMVKVPIVCDPVVKPSSNDVAYDHGEFDVENVKLSLTTYQNEVPGSNPGSVCPAFKVTSRAETSKAGAVSMRLWRQKNGGAITSKVVQAWSSYNASKNAYFAIHQEFEDVGTTSWYQFMVEIVDNSLAPPSDGWKDITVHCSNPGGGGLAPEPKDDNDLPKPQASWTGELIVADSAGSDKSCPRSGQVFFEVTRPEPGDFDYRISCSNGAYFEGTATGFDQGSGIFEAYGAHDISINKTRNIQCTLQEMTPAPVTVAVDKEGFTCNNPAIDPDADDLVSEPRPNPKKPGKPLVLVDPVIDPTHDCAANQILVKGKCVNEPKKPIVSILCKSGFELKGTICVKKPDISILCKKGFKLVGKTCVKKPEIVVACAEGEQHVKGKCMKKPVVSIFCKKGFKQVGKSCVRIPTIAENPLGKLKGLGIKKVEKQKVFKKKAIVNKPFALKLAPTKTLKLKKLKPAN